MCICTHDSYYFLFELLFFFLFVATMIQHTTLKTDSMQISLRRGNIFIVMLSL
jgi:hypothetical protein